ncbi:MAG: mechanosensitive ion channel family protein [Methylobacterium mesophilicum]|nr:mechanosensitive ion channel family protein [Methylobacterium mesophilicum]
MALFAALAGGATAQDQQLADQPPSIVAQQNANLDKLTNQFESVRASVKDASNDDAKLVDVRSELDNLSRAVIDSGVAFRPRLTEINDRLTQLGNPPAEGQPAEPDVIAKERQTLAAEKAEINAVIGRAEQLSIGVNNAVNEITTLRRNLFASMLTRRYTIDYALFGEVADAFQSEGAALWRTVASWLTFVMQYKLESVLAACFFALGAAAVLLIGGQRLLGRLYEPNAAITNPTVLGKLSVAFWSTLLKSATLSLFLGVTWLLFDYFQVLRGDIGQMMWSLFQVISIVYFVHRLGMAVLSPRLPSWRLITVESRAASLLVALSSTMALITGLDYFLSSVYQLRSSPLSLTVGESFISTILTGLLVVLIGFVRPFVDESGRPRPWPRWVKAVIFLLGALIIVPTLLGYIGFARFVSRQIVITGAILALLGIGLMSGRAISEENALLATRFGRGLRRRLKLDETTLDQLSLALSVAIYLLVIFGGVPLILLQWGFQPVDLWNGVVRLADGFMIGSFRFSPLGLAIGLLIFVLGYFVTRWFQGWLDGTVMARGKVDVGVRNSIRMMVGYAGYAVAALIAVSAAGINLSSLAIVAGALSVGIGFGLQNIVNNFVSGLILLAERPFKVGDWVVAGTVQGTVKKVSVRATEIETFQRQTVIMPNSELINSAVANWTHRNKLGRLEIRVNLAYGMNARRAYDVMAEIARSHPLVLRNPEPQIVFLNFTAFAMELEMRVFLADVLNQISVQNDLRFAIVEAFDREGLEMASNPRAVVEKTVPPQPAEEEPVAHATPDPVTAETPSAEEEPVRRRKYRG